MKHKKDKHQETAPDTPPASQNDRTEELPQDDEQVLVSKKELEALRQKEKELAQQEDRCLRLQAEFENVRKRLERDKAEFVKFANEEIIGELIPIVDDFQRAFDAADRTRDFNVLHKGVEMILAHLLELLRRKGVTPIEAAGKPFDPAYHEALLQVDSDEYPEHTVIEEMQKGYMLNNRVLRTAKVKVSKRSQANPEAVPEEQKPPDETPAEKKDDLENS